MKKWIATICALLCMFGLVACSGDVPTTGQPSKPVSIALSGQKTDFIYGDRFTTAGLKVKVTLDDGNTRLARAKEYTVDAGAYDATKTGSYTIAVKLVADATIAATYTVTVRKTPPSGGGDGPIVNNIIDVYIIAGQSNAEGSSNITQVDPQSGSTYRSVLATADRRNADGYDVRYFGAVNVLQDLDMPKISLQNVKMGLGTNADRIGPELGMANVLQDNGKTAAIFKYASGGTFLCDVNCQVDVSRAQGTWASPSILAPQKEAGLTPDEHLAGLMYRRLCYVVQEGCAALREIGYIPVVKGFIWMQGEADSGDAQCANLYEEYLNMFIADLRADVARVAGNPNAQTCPFVIGKISPNGWYSGDPSAIARIRDAQDRVAAANENVYTIDTADLIINDGNTCLGSDQWHFNARDMYTLGKRFAAKALEAQA